MLRSNGCKCAHQYILGPQIRNILSLSPPILHTSARTVSPLGQPHIRLNSKRKFALITIKLQMRLINFSVRVLHNCYCCLTHLLLLLSLPVVSCLQLKYSLAYLIFIHIDCLPCCLCLQMTVTVKTIWNHIN